MCCGSGEKTRLMNLPASNPQLHGLEFRVGRFVNEAFEPHARVVEYLCVGFSVSTSEVLHVLKFTGAQGMNGMWASHDHWFDKTCHHGQGYRNLYSEIQSNIEI